MQFPSRYALLVIGPLSLWSAGCTSMGARPITDARATPIAADRLMSMAQVYEQKGQYTEASQLYAQVLSSQPNNHVARQRMNDLMMALSGQTPASHMASAENGQLNEVAKSSSGPIDPARVGSKQRKILTDEEVAARVPQPRYPGMAAGSVATVNHNAAGPQGVVTAQQVRTAPGVPVTAPDAPAAFAPAPLASAHASQPQTMAQPQAMASLQVVLEESITIVDLDEGIPNQVIVSDSLPINPVTTAPVAAAPVATPPVQVAQSMDVPFTVSLAEEPAPMPAAMPAQAMPAAMPAAMPVMQPAPVQTVQAMPVQTAPVQSAPVQPAPVEAAPVQTGQARPIHAPAMSAARPMPVEFMAPPPAPVAAQPDPFMLVQDVPALPADLRPAPMPVAAVTEATAVQPLDLDAPAEQPAEQMATLSLELDEPAAAEAAAMASVDLSVPDSPAAMSLDLPGLPALPALSPIEVEAEAPASMPIDFTDASEAETPAPAVPPLTVPALIELTSAEVPAPQPAGKPAPFPSEPEISSLAEMEPAPAATQPVSPYALICPEAKGALKDALTKLASKDLSVRKGAIESIVACGPEAKAAIPALKACLNDADAAIRGYAAWGMWHVTGDFRQALQPLCDLLSSHNETAIVFACYVLGSMGEHAAPAVEPLKKLQDDDSHAIRVHSSEAMLKIQPTDRHALHVLTASLGSHNPEERSLAAMALGSATGRSRTSAIEMLTSALHDSDSSVRCSAALALGGFGSDAMLVLDTLREIASTEDEETRLAANRAISCIVR